MTFKEKRLQGWPCPAAREQECGSRLGWGEEPLCSAFRGQRLAEVVLVLSWQHVPGWLRRARWRQPGNNRSKRSLLLLSAPPRLLGAPELSLSL